MFIPFISAVCGATSAADDASQTAIRLTHRFTAGQETVYNFSSALRQQSTVSGEKLLYSMTLAGTVRHIVVDVDPRTGVALFGLLGTGTWTMVSGPGGIAGETRDQTWIASYRIEPTGKIVARDTRKEDRMQNFVHRIMNQVSENAQVFPAFPTNEVLVGSRWKGPVLLPVPGIRQPGEADATVTSVQRENGTNCCAIKTAIASEKGRSFATYQSDLHLPTIEITGNSEGLFDIDRGAWITTRIELAAKLAGPSFDGSMDVRGSTCLIDAARPADAELRARIADFRKIEDAIARMYDGDLDGAETSLNKQKRDAVDVLWHKGIATTLGLLDQVRKEIAAGKDTQVRNDRPEARLLAEADKAAQEEKWKDAVQRYEKIAREYDSTEAAIQALSSAAEIYDRRLGDKSAAAALHRRIAKMHEEKAKRGNGTIDATLSLYKSAGSYENAGDLKKSARAYESFLAAATNGVPAQIRVTARYRLAGVYEKLEDRRKALDAYRAVDAAEEDDDYSRKLKDKARGKIAEYGTRR